MSERVRVVYLSGDVGIETAAAGAAEIQALLGSVEMVLLSLSQATDIGLAGVQLILAAFQTADGLGHEFHLTGAVPEIVSQRLVAGGFIAESILDGRALEGALRARIRRSEGSDA